MTPAAALPRPSPKKLPVREAPTLSPGLQLFLQHARRRSVPSKTVLVSAGETAEQLFYVLAGSVEVLIEDDSGNEIVLAYLSKGQFFGEMGLFGIDRRTAFVRARGRAEIAEIPYSRFRQLANETPSLTFEIATQLAMRLERTNRKLGDLAFVDVSGRIAHALLDLCDEPEAMTHPEGTQIRVSRQELSRLVGCSREMAGRVLKALEAQGLLQARGKTIVLYDVRPATRGMVAARTMKTLPGKPGRAQPAAAIAARMARTVAA
jgi:CRP/FNR family transcriptional regulator, cyclic AMP receptor protein